MVECLCLYICGLLHSRDRYDRRTGRCSLMEQEPRSTKVKQGRVGARQFFLPRFVCIASRDRTAQVRLPPWPVFTQAPVLIVSTDRFLRTGQQATEMQTHARYQNYPAGRRETTVAVSTSNTLNTRNHTRAYPQKGCVYPEKLLNRKEQERKPPLFDFSFQATKY